MTSKNLLVLLVAAFALVAFASSVSAFGTVTLVEVDGTEVFPDSSDLQLDAGETVSVRVEFTANEAAENVRVRARFLGESEVESKEIPEVVAGGEYSRTVQLQIPYDFSGDEEDLLQSRELRVIVESTDNGDIQVPLIEIGSFRESYRLDILAVDMQPEVRAGESFAVDVVLKNRGHFFADDAFLRVSIPELGLETTTYYGDLSSFDQSNPDKEDAVERRTFLRIPVNAPAGLYTVIFEAFDDESRVTAERRVLVTGASEGALPVPSETSKTFSVGETAEYKLTLVNRGTTISVYMLDVNAPSNLNVRLSDNIVVVPAGSSRTVSIFADSSVRDDYTFTVNVNSEEGAVVAQETFFANVVENGGNGSGITGTANATVLLTVILAIIFIVLLVVLIVLLTRKPETKEEFGESYY